MGGAWTTPGVEAFSVVAPVEYRLPTPPERCCRRRATPPRAGELPLPLDAQRAPGRLRRGGGPGAAGPWVLAGSPRGRAGTEHQPIRGPATGTEHRRKRPLYPLQKRLMSAL